MKGDLSEKVRRLSGKYIVGKHDNDTGHYESLGVYKTKEDATWASMHSYKSPEQEIFIMEIK